jgi:membrane-associated phospholipid phosphatase
MEILALTLLGWLVMYFFVNRRNLGTRQYLDFSTDWDRKTPYWPMFALVYFSTYIFVVQPFFFLSDPRQFYLMLACFVSISGFSSLIHAIVPSKIERVEEVTVGGASGWMLGIFQKTCKPYGNFPSMHVGLSVPVVLANYMVGGPFIGSLTLVWALLIAASTLFTKQHYIIDVLAGMAGGIVIFSLFFWLMLA